MILISIMLGALVMSATAVAGLLVVLTIRQATDAQSSSQAFFAADAGVEAGLGCYFQSQGNDFSACGTKATPATLTLDNGAKVSYWVTRDSATGIITSTGDGVAGRTERILETSIVAQ